MDDERLKQGNQLFGKEYFTELLERIREIRSSERMFYQKITDLYAQCSIDYDSELFKSRYIFSFPLVTLMIDNKEKLIILFYYYRNRLRLIRIPNPRAIIAYQKKNLR